MDVMFLLILMTQFIGSLAQPDLQQQAAVNRQRSQHSLHLNLPKHNRGNSVENQGLPNQKSGQKVEFNYQRQDQPRQKPNNVAQIWLGKKKRKSIHQLKVNEPVVSGIPSIGGLPKTPIGLQNGQDKHKLKTGGIFNRVGSQDHAAGDSQYRRANRAEGDGRVDARKSLRRFGGVQSGAVHDLHLSPDTGAQVQGRALELENNRVRPQNSLRHQRPLPSTPSPEKVVNSDEATNEEDDLKSQQDNRDIAPPRRGDLPPDGNNQSPQQSLSGNLNNGGNYGGNIKNFQRGVIRTVEDNPNGQPMVDNGRYVQQQRHPANDGNFQNFNGAGVNINVPPQQSSREIGGIRLTWDWSDFAVTFDDYGGSELKVRRAPHATTGEPWPLPQYYVKKEKKILKLDKKHFDFKIIAQTCDVIEEAVVRYRKRVLEDTVEDMYDNLQNAEGTRIDDPVAKYDTDLYRNAPVVAKVDIKIRKPCSKYPSVKSDESYDLVVKKSRAFIWANEVWGALRGLETFSHLVWQGLDGADSNDRHIERNLYIKETVISDYPRFPHRGILIDSSRHFVFKDVIFDVLDGMEQNKMNVLHWHIVDDQSFPYESEVYPELSRKGAFHPTFVYTQDDIAEIIQYARFRGIRVMPEFDTPGHTYSWGLSRPDLLTQCFQGGTPVKGYLGPIDPSKNSTYRFLKSLFAEVLDTFKDQYIHLGGDEVPLGCWQSNPEVINFGLDIMKKGNRDASLLGTQNSYYQSVQFDVRKVYEYYANRLMKDLREIGRKRKEGVKFIMWQEVINNDLQLPNDTIIQVWMGDMGDVNRAISMGYQVVYATCWYLDHIEYGTKWTKYYQCDPADTTYGYVIDEKKVLGGEACLWSEYIDNENLMTTLWPRASATAERLWSAKDVRDLDSAGARLQEHRCRMLGRGLSVAQISGPDYCLKRGVSRSRIKTKRNSTCVSGRCVKSRDGSFLEIEDIQLHLTHRGGSISDCGSAMTSGGSVLLLGSVVIILLAVAIGFKKTSGRINQSRICKNRTILIMFVSVLLIYFMCYTTIWMQVFEFSGSFHKRREHDEPSDKR